MYELIYFLLLLFASLNMLLRAIKPNKTFLNKKPVVIIASLLFALMNMVLLNANISELLAKYGLAYFIFTSLVLFLCAGVRLIFKLKVYDDYLASVLEVWELATYLPIFFGFLYFAVFVVFDFSILLFLCSAVLFYIICKNAIKTPQIKEIKLTSNKLKNDLRLVLIADIHLKKNLNDMFFKDIITKINEQNPDCVLIAGDLIDTSVSNVKCLHYLNDLSSKYGTFYVLGNHEYYHGIDNIIKELLKYDIKFLNNLSFEFDDFEIFGINDLMGEKLKIYKPSFDNFNPNKNKFNILLSHQPKVVKKYNVDDYDLILSGHTHSGQIFPFSLAVKLEQGFLSGLYKLKNNSFLYVTSGAGFWGLAARLNAKSEIVLLHIKANNN